jgi:hypothetical protein
MPFISVTRLRIRSIRFLPAFAWQTWQARAQLRVASGFRSGALLLDRRWTFWTLTAWDDEKAMRAYMTTGAHRSVMPHLLTWCDEASVVHWIQDEDDLPSWGEADRRMRASGRPSKVRHPSPAHAMLVFAPPRPWHSGPVRPRAGAG